MFETSAAGVADMLDNLYSGEEDWNARNSQKQYNFISP